LFKYLFAGYDFNDPLDGLEDIPEVKFIKLNQLTNAKFRRDGSIEGIFNGKRWVLLSSSSGGSQYGGHFTNKLYNKKVRSYIDLNNMYSEVSIISRKKFLRSFSRASSANDTDPVLALLNNRNYATLADEEKKGLLHLLRQETSHKNNMDPLLVQLINKKTALTYKETIEMDRRVNTEMGRRAALKMNYEIQEHNDDRECVIMDVNAFKKYKNDLKLPTVSPAYTRNNCYFATALVRLAVFYQASLVFSKPLHPISNPGASSS